MPDNGRLLIETRNAKVDGVYVEDVVTPRAAQWNRPDG